MVSQQRKNKEDESEAPQPSTSLSQSCTGKPDRQRCICGVRRLAATLAGSSCADARWLGSEKERRQTSQVSTSKILMVFSSVCDLVRHASSGSSQKLRENHIVSLARGFKGTPQGSKVTIYQSKQDEVMGCPERERSLGGPLCSRRQPTTY